MWRYGITLPESLASLVVVDRSNGRASSRRARDGRIIVTGLDVEQPKWRDDADNNHLRRDSLTAKSDRELVESNVAGVLNAIANTLSKA